jgi:hypothetical protein
MHQGANPLLNKIKALRAIFTQRLQLGVDTSSTNAGAISVVTPVTALVCTTGAETRTLANGYEGQIKFMFFMTDGGGTIAVTPANLRNGNTITFTDVNEGWLGIFYGGEWNTLLGDAQVCAVA